MQRFHVLHSTVALKKPFNDPNSTLCWIMYITNPNMLSVRADIASPVCIFLAVPLFSIYSGSYFASCPTRYAISSKTRILIMMGAGHLVVMTNHMNIAVVINIFLMSGSRFVFIEYTTRKRRRMYATRYLTSAFVVIMRCMLHPSMLLMKLPRISM